jgi:amylosucrase
MYEQISHSLLNDILTEIEAEIKDKDFKYFYTRLGSNFYAIYTLFHQLYGHRPDFKQQLSQLVKVISRAYMQRSQKLRKLDLAREKNHDWFLSQQWVGYALYCKEFANNLQGLQKKLDYLDDLGINMLHIMPILDCPSDESDGGYAVRDFRKINPDVGSIKDLDNLVTQLKKRNTLLVLDVVVNHTSDQHVWAVEARKGNPYYQDYYYVFNDRHIPDLYEETMPEIFPENAPGNFTWNVEMGKWVMTVFNDYQWDLNYQNPAVMIEMMDIILFWANHGADIIRLDAVAFLWKKIGTTCQNEHEAHLILQLMKDCCQVAAPGVLFIAEAIVAPVEVIKYFGEDAINAKECEIAYNATLMALLWEALATKKTSLFYKAITNIPDKLERTTWLNYARCHDDIGLGFDDNDIRAAGYDPVLHRQFLMDYYTGKYALSTAKGIAFGTNKKNGDARIAGSLASLAGLETAIEIADEVAIHNSIQSILMLHGLIMSFGGIPLIYYGDALGTLNDHSYLDDAHKKDDSRWIHRPSMDWQKSFMRHNRLSIEAQIFNGIKAMIAVRKATLAFADHNNRTLLPLDNDHLLAFLRYDGVTAGQSFQVILVIANFDHAPHRLKVETLRTHLVNNNTLKNLLTGELVDLSQVALVINPLSITWFQC